MYIYYSPMSGNKSVIVEEEGKTVFGVGPGTGRRFIKEYFPKAKKSIHIASAYFTLKGYRLIRNYIPLGVQLHFLVGKSDARETQEAVIEEIRRELRECRENLRDVVAELIQRIRNNEFIIRDARKVQIEYHPKIYIIDSIFMYHGSSNCSGKGIDTSIEQLAYIQKRDIVKPTVVWFNEEAKQAKDMLAELLEELEKYLQYAPPFDIYLRTLLHLNEYKDYEAKKGIYRPNYYQKFVASNAIRQLDRWGGTFVLVDTGLGKTVIGAEIVRYLYHYRNIRETILLTPASLLVQQKWREQLSCRYVNYRMYGSKILFSSSSSDPACKISELEEDLRQANAQTVIIVDEAHLFRNQLITEFDKGISKVYSRLEPAIAKGVKVILLTATPYSTTRQNINSLLRLLPRRVTDIFSNPIPWGISKSEELPALPIVTSLGIFDVLKAARDRGDLDQEGRVFIPMGGQNKYLPKQINLQLTYYKPYLYTDVKDVFDLGYFNQYRKTVYSYFSEDDSTIKKGRTDSTSCSSIDNWLSSPDAFADGLEKNINTLGVTDNSHQLPIFPDTAPTFDSTIDIDCQKAYDTTTMYLGVAKRQKKLRPLLKKLEHIKDDKFLQLHNIISQHIYKNKIIVFVHHQATALYLQNHLTEKFENLRIGCTVIKGNSGKVGLKSPKKRAAIFRKLANYDIIITTDADSEGIDLEQANVLINYDLESGIDRFIQRIGRILRMTNNANRSVFIYTFVPLLPYLEDISSQLNDDIERKFIKIIERYEKASHLSGKGFSFDPKVEISLENESTVEQFVRNNISPTEVIGHGTITKNSHLSVLEKYKCTAKADEIRRRSCIFSTRQSLRERTSVFVLVKYKKQFYPLLFNPDTHQLENENEQIILEQIACVESDVSVYRRNITSDVVDHAQKAIQVWCKKNDRKSAKAEMLAVLYLLSKNARQTISF